MEERGSQEDCEQQISFFMSLRVIILSRGPYHIPETATMQRLLHHQNNSPVIIHMHMLPSSSPRKALQFQEQ